MLLELVVDERGSPTDIRVVSPLGYGLDERAQEAITKWRFQPGLKNGSPVKISANIEVNFRLLGATFNAELEERRTQYNRAIGLLKGDAKEKEWAVKIFQELTPKKFPAAMFAYGQLLAAGKDVPPDPKESRNLIYRAAQAKYGPAMFTVASESLEEKGNSKPLKEGQDMMREAAHFGSTQAQYFLGFANEHGNPDLRHSARRGRCASILSILCCGRTDSVPVPAGRSSLEPAERAGA